MENTWSLDALYTGYNDAFDKDVETFKELVKTLNDNSKNLKTREDVETFMHTDAKLQNLMYSLFSYVRLNLSTNILDEKSNEMNSKLNPIADETARAYAIFNAFLVEHKDDFPEWVASSDFIKEHEFVLQEVINKGDYLLSEDVEDAIAKMSQNGSTNWSNLQGHLTSTAQIEFNGEKHTLSSIRNLAYSSDKAVRKSAYETELKLYEQIDDGVAFALNSIKGEVNTVNALRGYTSPIQKTLIDSRMSQDTLDALTGAIEKYLPVFRKYLKHKGTLLGHENGLPFYDLFAPFETQNPKTYSVEESRTMILDSFGHFSDDLQAMAKRAYDESWIDFHPRPGKRNGAFCSNLPQIKQSRVLTNFDGSISDIITIAHELGHAYHGMLIEDQSILNSNYTMPVAETASTFCENIVLNAALKTASDEEKLVLLENSISDLVQITVDIMSRFKFEREVFERRNHTFLLPKDLNEIMLKAQDDTYGDGLDPNARHPYMWIPKPHYYSGGLSFYNFPYAFGGLFALGLYGKFEAEGEAFVPQYRKLLEATTTHSCEDVAKMANIDVTDQAFWESSLEVVSKRIDAFIALTQK